MPLPFISVNSVGAHFFQPLDDVWPKLTSSRVCNELPDLDFIRLGVARVLSQAKSGRDFLQSHANFGGKPVAVNHFFETIKSPRRLSICSEVNGLLVDVVNVKCSDPFLEFPELNSYDLYAGDGHSHKAAAHDEVKGSCKQPLNHFIILNLRSRALHYFALGDAGGVRKREHDMRAIKRHGLGELRFNAKKGRKVFVVWDRAGIDFHLWHKAKQHGVYFLSREKDNMRLEVIGNIPFDKKDVRNQGILSDDFVATSQGTAVRRVTYHDPVGETTYTYLTSNQTLPPGLIALLYKRRWDIEKVFDETKNRFQEGKAWASSDTAKEVQGQMICITHNLCLLIENELQTVDLISNDLEIQRRAKRIKALDAKMSAKNIVLPFVYRAVERLTQRGVKLIRWLRNYLYSDRLWQDATNQLRSAYATL